MNPSCGSDTVPQVKRLQPPLQQLYLPWLLLLLVCLPHQLHPGTWARHQGVTTHQLCHHLRAGLCLQVWWQEIAAVTVMQIHHSASLCCMFALRIATGLYISAVDPACKWPAKYSHEAAALSVRCLLATVLVTTAAVVHRHATSRVLSSSWVCARSVASWRTTTPLGHASSTCAVTGTLAVMLHTQPHLVQVVFRLHLSKQGGSSSDLSSSLHTR